ncbi:hypothetical protein CPC08DRAFT_129803 [Agrocybe pediades]|nr:hypothetical protein CPC08DRAFT_129803 [Agrocybe pediades]
MDHSLPPFLSPFNEIPSSEYSKSYQHATFHHENDLGSSHAIWWSPCEAEYREPDIVLLFIPGNPGLAEFYIPFLSMIKSFNSSRNIAIMAHSHLDHHARINNVGSRYPQEQSLTIQVECALEVLMAIKQHYSSKTKIVVIGHSVGAWISLQMLKASPAIITASFLLFPTLSHIAQTPNGRRLSPIFSGVGRSLLSWCSPVTGYFPRCAFSRIFPSWPQSQILVLRDFLSSQSCVLASLSMAKQEMSTITDLDVAFLSQHTSQLFFYYGQKDDWVGEEKQALIQCFDSGNELMNVAHGPPDVPHAFCINHSETVAKQCYEWLDRLLGN